MQRSVIHGMMFTEDQMRITDEIRVKCSFRTIIEDIQSEYSIYPSVSEKLADEEKLIKYYCEGISFIIGMHPKGGFAYLEDLQIISTETNLIQWLHEEHMEISPEYFLVHFIASNVMDEGTPMFIRNK